MEWNIILHYANENQAGEHAEIDVATLATYAGYGDEQFEVYQINQQPVIEKAEEIRASGGYAGATTTRDEFTVALYPFSYSDRSIFDTLKTIAGKRYKWIELNTQTQDGSINVGNTTDYHSTGYAIPISIQEIATQHNASTGKKFVTLTCKRRFVN